MYKENKDSKINFSSEKIKCNEKLHQSRKNKNLSCKFISRNILWYEGEQEMNEIIAI